MSSASQSAVFGFEQQDASHDHDHHLGIFPFHSIIFNPQSLSKTLPTNLPLPPLLASDSPDQSSSRTKHKDGLITAQFAGISQLASLQRSPPGSNNHWGLGEMSRKKGDDEEEHDVGISRMKMKKIIKGRRKVREPRFCFKTLSDVDVLDDGYKWRKYGQKIVKNTQHPRSYYRCTQDNCRVKKRVERLADDPRMVITTYEGRHVHSPSLDDDDDDNHDIFRPSSKHSDGNSFFW